MRYSPACPIRERTTSPCAELEAARARIAGVVHRTPLLSSTTAAAWTTAATGVRLADDRLYLKAENLQKTGSFKARGMSNRIMTLSPEAASRGAITLSAGNAGQAYAWAGRTAGVAVTVVMPVGAVRSKVDACLGYGARVVLSGAHVGETLAELDRIREAEGLELVHPFDDPAVIAGNASVGFELIEDLPDLDVVVVGVGGGGLISGVAAALKARRPGIRVYGVEPEGSTAMTQALAQNEIVRVQPASVADGLGAPFAGAWTMAMVRRHVDDIVLLDDPTILAGMRFGDRADEAGARAGRCRRPRRGPGRSDPDPRGRTGRGDRLGRERRCRPARERCSMRRGRCPERRRDRGVRTRRAGPDAVRRSTDADRTHARRTADGRAAANRADADRADSTEIDRQSTPSRSRRPRRCQRSSRRGA